MANIYVTEPATEGRILLVTSKGEIEVELWAKEAPKACRNVIALALEGYYDNCIFHRIVPGFCIQTGDPTGTGVGGESFYGQPFENEPHQRLKFTKRGMVAMANTGDFATNESQFFITLDATPELQGKFTVFGRVVGQTIYNVLSIADVELKKDEPDRPVYPPKLLRVDVLDNPFDDIVPRITREEKRQQMRAKKEAAERKAKDKERRSVKKNTALLSFGEAEETTGEQLKGPKSSHDLLTDKKLSKQRAIPEPESTPIASSSSLQLPPPPSLKHEDDQAGTSKKRKHKDASDVEPVPEDLASLRANTRAKESAADQIRSLEASLRGLNKQSKREGHTSERDKKVRRGRELLQEARAKYLQASQADSISSNGKGKAVATREREKAGGDERTLALLAKFQNRMRTGDGTEREGGGTGEAESRQRSAANGDEDDDEDEKEGREYGASDDDDTDWRSHRLEAGGVPLSGREDKYSVDDYEVLDPRNEPKPEEKKHEGKRGRDWVEERNWVDRKPKPDGRHSGRNRNGPSRFDHRDRDRGQGPYAQRDERRRQHQ